MKARSTTACGLRREDAPSVRITRPCCLLGWCSRMIDCGCAFVLRSPHLNTAGPQTIGPECSS